jgi:antitoxin HicB
MVYHFRVHKEKAGGYWAECVELPGCVTQGDTRVELSRNMTQALNTFLDEPEDSRAKMALPRRRVAGKNIERVEADPKVALAFVLRQTRLRRGISQIHVARAILGVANPFTYQRLESSRTANPEFSTLVKLKKAWPELDLDEILEQA